MFLAVFCSFFLLSFQPDTSSLINNRKSIFFKIDQQEVAINCTVHRSLQQANEFFLGTMRFSSNRNKIVAVLVSTLKFHSAKAFVVVKHPTQSLVTMSASVVPTLLETMSEACSKSLGQTVELQPAAGGGAGGGGGASISAAIDKNTGKKYFIKKASLPSGGKMLNAEYSGVKEMAETGTIKVPNPIAFGEFHGEPRNCAFVVFEYLEFCRGGSGFELGQQLAKVSILYLHTYIAQYPVVFALVTLHFP